MEAFSDDEKIYVTKHAKKTAKNKTKNNWSRIANAAFSKVQSNNVLRCLTKHCHRHNLLSLSSHLSASDSDGTENADDCIQLFQQTGYINMDIITFTNHNITLQHY